MTQCGLLYTGKLHPKCVGATVHRFLPITNHGIWWPFTKW